MLKAGFLFSGRAGSGIIVARLPDGSWSSPSAIVTAGAGVGGQIGAELTDFVFILNTTAAVESFAQAGSITLGGNVSLAAGPLGRNAEAAGTASLKSAAAIFSYSKTKGLFAGVSLEGSVIVERRDANRKFYGGNCTAKTILSGRVDAPPAVDPLLRVLESRAFSRKQFDYNYEDDDYYNDIPTSFSDDESSDYGGGRRKFNSRNRGRSNSYERGSYSDEEDEEEQSSRFSGPRRSRTTQDSNSFARSGATKSSWEDDVFDRSVKSPTSDSKPHRPNSSKPQFGSVEDLAVPKGHKAVALFTFLAEQEGDLPFKKGDYITILKKSETEDDWWSGKCNGKEGIFPANYIEIVN